MSDMFTPLSEGAATLITLGTTKAVVGAANSLRKGARRRRARAKKVRRKRKRKTAYA